jgi:hypothetical protein
MRGGKDDDVRAAMRYDLFATIADELGESAARYANPTGASASRESRASTWL